VTLRAALVIALRFYALSLAVETISLVPGVVGTMASLGPLSQIELLLPMQLAAYLIMGLFVWFMAGRLAGAVTRGLDGNISFQLNFEDGCALAFVFLGIYFALNGLAPMLGSFFRLLQWDGPHLNQDRFQASLMRDVERWAIEFVAGIGCVIGARKWARLIASRRRGDATA